MASLRALFLSVSMAPLLCVGMHAGQAQDVDAGMQAREAQAHELFSLMHMEATYSQVTRQMMGQIQRQSEQLLPQTTMNDAQKQEYASFMRRVETLVTGTASWQVLEPEFERIYAENLTGADLDGIIAFYRSPAGRAFVEKEPQLLAAASALSVKRVQTVMPQLESMMQDEMKTMAEKTSPPAAPAPETKN